MSAAATPFRCHYAGIPYADRGRSIDGCDCWGLVRLVFLAEAGIVLPGHSEISSKDLRALARLIDGVRHGGGDVWRKVAEGEALAPLDVCVMTRPGHTAPCHVGVYGGGGRILHAEIETDAAWVRLDHPSLAGRVLGFWRHRALVGSAPTPDRTPTPPLCVDPPHKGEGEAPTPDQGRATGLARLRPPASVGGEK